MKMLQQLGALVAALGAFAAFVWHEFIERMHLK
jgi:hypothetical protein